VHHLRKRWREGDHESAHLPVWRFTRFAVPTYLSQVIYLCSGTEMVKLLVSKLIGITFTAAFGFAAALAGTIQRYLPSFLLIGWVRPLFITARQQGRPHEELVELAGTVIKLNLLVLAPIATLLCVSGAELVHLLSGGRMADSLAYLYFFLVLLAVQTVRALIALLGMTLEIGSGGLMATSISLGGLTVGVLAFPVFGIWALAFGLLLSELLWGCTMVFFLRQHGMRYRLPWVAIGKFMLSVLVPWMMMESLLQFQSGSAPMLALLALGFLAALLCLLLSALLRPFNEAERSLINRLLPLKIFVW